ncbi:hypothetical protein R6V09_44165 [Streptomyces sp. W16]|uniref:hypothetical protein n=1 Tax=Streptomyces sp. W16 TaxID=3076631 RepID=UPI00295AB0A8|nr:hypothetical protein [Streptomyces sp. W16]MDV9177112.1 hypothetical protein [Streptomyces sp. W16]
MDQLLAARRLLAAGAVMETAGDGALTGQALPGLHEDLLTSDPGGRDGADLWL